MKKILLLILSWFCITAYGDALNDLSALLSKAHSATATFTQTVTDAEGQVLQSSTGVMRFLKPGYFWWDIQTPNRQLILVKKGSVYFYQADLEQLTVKPFNLNQTQTPATLLLNGNIDVLTKHYKARKETERHLVSFILTPITDNQLLKSILISFDGDRLVALDLADHLDHVTNISFQNFKLNPAMDASQFSFKFPKGTDVIHE